jgi:excisionase family DNA binding protein
VPQPTHLKRLSAHDPTGTHATGSAYTVEGAGRRLGNIGRTTIYGLIGSGRLEAVKLGSRTLITAASIDALLASLPRVVAKPERQREDGA